MSAELIIHLDRTNRVPLNIGVSVVGDTFTSEIREERDPESTLIATWDCSFLTDGSDAEIVLVLPEAELTGVTEQYGYMDVKRTSGGEDFPVFAEPLKVKFQKVVTA